MHGLARVWPIGQSTCEGCWRAPADGCEEDLKEGHIATLHERSEYLRAATGIEVSRSVIRRTIKKLGSTRKRGRTAIERDEFKRAAWRVMVSAVVGPESLVFVDECGVHTSLAPIYGSDLWLRSRG